jgi:hypothetical protein
MNATETSPDHPAIRAQSVESHRATMIVSLEIPEPDGPPPAHFSKFQTVETWEPREV